MPDLHLELTIDVAVTVALALHDRLEYCKIAIKSCQCSECLSYWLEKSNEAAYALMVVEAAAGLADEVKPPPSNRGVKVSSNGK